MRTLTEEDIRTRAYKLWKAAGEQNTKMDAFWSAQHGPDGRSLARMRLTSHRNMMKPVKMKIDLEEAAN